MPVTILLLTEAVEAARLGAVLRGAFGPSLRLLEDLEGPPEEALSGKERAEVPGALVLGMGLLGLDVAAYLNAAAQAGRPVCLLCPPALEPQAQKLRAQAVLLRPVSGPELVATLRRLMAGSRPPAQPLLRIDDVLPDPLSLLSELPAEPDGGRRSTVSGQFQPVAVPTAVEVPEPAVKVAIDPSLYEEAPSGRRRASASGQFHRVMGRPGGDGPAGPEGVKVAVDPSLYHDEGEVLQMADAGAVEEISIEEQTPVQRPQPQPQRRAPAAPSGPPPLPKEAQERPRRRTEPPPLPQALPAPARPEAPPRIPPEGDLQTTDPAALVGWICTAGITGCLQLTREDPQTGVLAGQRALYFENGDLVAATSTLPADSLPELLHQEGRLSREQLKRAQKVLADAHAGDISNRRLAQLLSDEHLLPRPEIAPLLRRHVIEIFYRCLGWERGRYKLVSRPAPLEDRVRLKETPKLLLLEGLRRKASLESLIARVGPDDTVLQPVSSGGLLLKDAGVTAFEQRALPLFDGRHSLLQVSRQSGLAEHATYVLAYALLCLHGLRRPPPAGRKEPPAAPETADEPLAWQKERVQRKLIQVEMGDYFEMLEIDRDASAEEIRRAYKARRAEFGKERLAPQCLAEMAKELQLIGALLDEAYLVLSDDGRRAAYRQNLLPLSYQEMF